MNKDKPLGKKAYGSIPHVRGSRVGEGEHHITEGQENIVFNKARDYKDLIIVQEKTDGSNCSVAKIDGKLVALTRAGYPALSSRFEQHHLFDRWVEKHAVYFHYALKEGERVIGEWLLQAHGTKYNIDNEGSLFVAFDIMKGNGRLTYHDFLLRCCNRFVTPRLIHIGQPIKLKNIIKNLEPSGHGAIDPVEGAVIRCEREGRVDFICKYVRPDKVDGKYFPQNTGGELIWNYDPKGAKI